MSCSFSHDSIKRTGFACTVYQDRFILLAGGSSKNGELISTTILDLHNQTCSDLPDLPTQMSNCEGAIINDYLYIINPGNKTPYRLSLTERSKWEQVHFSSLKIDSKTKSQTHFNTDLLSIGIYGKIFRHDAEKSKRIQIPKMPTTVFDFATVTVGNQIFVIGGINYNSQYLTSMMIFDATTQSWTTGPSLPAPLAGAAATTFKEWIVITGGQHDDNTFSNQVLIYDTLTRQWIQRNYGILQPRSNHRCVCVGSQIVCLGGWDRRRNYCSMEVVPINKGIMNELVRLRQLEQIVPLPRTGIHTKSKKRYSFTLRAKKLIPRWNRSNQIFQIQ